MSDILLKTKLFAPPARLNLVARPRLLARLDSGFQPGCKVILVCAPAGFGKTTLVAAWLAERGKIGTSPLSSSTSSPLPPAASQARYSWLSLDELDNLPQRFFSYLVASVQAAFPAAGRQILDLLALPRPLQPEELAGSLANDLAEIPGPYLLALDDFHVIHEVFIQDWLGHFIGALPPQVHILILSRQDPRLPLNRLRAGGQIVEVRLDDLRFSSSETAGFLNEVMGLNLDPADIAVLGDRTEGWAAGLQLAALSMHGLDDIHSFIQSFSGSNRFILDYLVEQVLARQPQPIQQFLLQTSALEKMCAELCDAVLEDGQSAVDDIKPMAPVGGSQPVLQLAPSPSQSVLETLDRSNLFLIPLDSERRWYRYHHLFRDLLSSQLKLARPELAGILQARAARWYDKNDLPREAVHYALAASDFDLAVQLIEKYSRQRWADADTEFITLVAQIPFEILRQHPELCVLRGWVLVIQGQLSQAAPFIREVEDRYMPYLEENRLEELTPAQRGMLGFVLGVQAYINETSGKETDIHRWMPLILDSVPESNVAYRNTMEVLIGILLTGEGDFATAVPLFLSAVGRDLEAGTSNAVCIGIACVARIQLVQGRLQDAYRICLNYQQKIEERGAWRFYLSGDLKAILADIWREWNDLEHAELLVRQAIQEDKPWPNPHSLSRCYTKVARILLSKGDLPGAQEAFRLAEQVVVGTQLPAENVIDLDEARVRLWLATGDLAAASRWALAYQAEAGDDFSFRHEARRTALSRVWLALDRPGEAVAELTHLARSAEASGRNGYLLKILVLLAVAYSQQNQGHLALETLEKALQLAEPEGYTRLFLDEGHPLQVLLAEFRRQAGRQPGVVPKRLQDYVDHLLAAFLSEGTSKTESAASRPGGMPPSLQRSLRAGALVEPLTGRELEILSLLASGLTNHEIARKLTISLHTVKAHISNLFQKLGVNNRTGAVQRGRELGLL